MKTISREKFKELKEYLEYDGIDQVFLTKLHEATGIVAPPSTEYLFYDENDNYIGNSNDTELETLLNEAGIGVRQE